MKRFISAAIAVVTVACLTLCVGAHSGGTDSNGGHRDNKNKSGLGSYHYHHGDGPHLHPNGVCPYGSTASTGTTGSTTTSGTGASTAKSGSGAGTASAAASSPKLTLTAEEQELLALARGCLGDGYYTVKDRDSCSLSLLQSIGDAANGSAFRLRCDVMDGKSVAARLILRPEKATKSIALGVTLKGERQERLAAKFAKHFDANVAVVSLAQQGAFGMEVELVVKPDLEGFDTENLTAYSYDAETNKYKAIGEGACTLDDKGYVHIKTSLAGDILITDKPA